jgi:hypothetical protein
MKQAFVLSAVAGGLISVCGCQSASSIVKALSHDPASWQITVTTPWGSAEYVRTGWLVVTNEAGRAEIIPAYETIPASDVLIQPFQGRDK